METKYLVAHTDDGVIRECELISHRLYKAFENVYLIMFEFKTDNSNPKICITLDFCSKYFRLSYPSYGNYNFIRFTREIDYADFTGKFNSYIPKIKELFEQYNLSEDYLNSKINEIKYDFKDLVYKEKIIVPTEKDLDWMKNFK